MPKTDEPITTERAGQHTLGDRTVHRLGYGGMKLTGPRVSGPPADRGTALAVLHRAVELGVDHIDTSDHYGPHVVNELIREALHPYPDDLVLATKVGARRTPDGGWVDALTPGELRRSVEDNLDHLDVDALDLVHLRLPGLGEPQDRSLAGPFEALAGLQQEGLVRHLGVCHVTARQVAEARGTAPLACVQNHYNVMHTVDDPLIDELAGEGVPYTALEGMSYTSFFPHGRLTDGQSARLDAVARRLGATPVQVVLAWLLTRSPNLLVIPGATTVAQLEEHLGAAALRLGPADVAELDGLAGAG